VCIAVAELDWELRGDRFLAISAQQPKKSAGRMEELSEPKLSRSISVEEAGGSCQKQQQLQKVKQKEESLALVRALSESGFLVQVLPKSGGTPNSGKGRRKELKDGLSKRAPHLRPRRPLSDYGMHSSRGVPSMLPWNNPKLVRRRIPIVAEPPFMLPKRKTTVKELAKAYQRRTRKHKTPKESSVACKHEEEKSSPDSRVEEVEEDQSEGNALNISPKEWKRPPVLSFDPKPLSNQEDGITEQESVETPEAFRINESGSFSIDGFEIDKFGITKAPNGRLPGSHSELIKIAVLGRGAGGTVYEMLHVSSLSFVALKEIPCFEKSKRQQLIQELKALYRNLAPIEVSNDPTNVSCPNIVAFYDAFASSEDCQVSIMMEYMDGGSLQDVVDAGGCAFEETLANVAESVAQGLHYLHERKQIHRDIKPSNLLINGKGEVKISDFGIVRDVREGEIDVETFVGTMLYMSPERINGEPYSFASDIWSCGLSLMAIALGRFPFKVGNGYWDMLHSINNGPIPVLPSDQFSKDFVELISTCMERDPGKRPTAAQLLEHRFLKSFQNLTPNGHTPRMRANDISDATEKLEDVCVKLVQHRVDKIMQHLMAASVTIEDHTRSRTPPSISRGKSEQEQAFGSALNAIRKRKKATARKSESLSEMGKCSCSTGKGRKCAFCMTATLGPATIIDGKPERSPREMAHIKRVSKKDCAKIADQIGLDPAIVRSRLNFHINQATDFLRRYRLYS